MVEAKPTGEQRFLIRNLLVHLFRSIRGEVAILSGFKIRV
jgi:hypothetical protein